MSVLIAFDPGATTGFCVFEDTRFITGGEVKDDLSLDGVLATYVPDLVLYESFRLFPNKAQAMIGSEFLPAQVIGTLRYLCKVRGVKMIEQPPMLKKFFMPVARLKYYGVDLKSEHARDAARHILYYLVFKQKLLPLPKESDVTETEMGTRARHTKEKSGHSHRPRKAQLQRQPRRSGRKPVRARA